MVLHDDNAIPKPLRDLVYTYSGADKLAPESPPEVVKRGLHRALLE